MQPITHDLTVTVSPGAASGTIVVEFHAEALPGTLAVFAGLLTIEGLDIYSATIHKYEDGTVRDQFEVRATHPRVDHDLLARHLCVKARNALLRRSSVAEQLRALPPRTTAALDCDPQVEFEMGSEITTGIRVRAADRPGLLHDLAWVLTENGLRTRSISVLTIAGIARDVFRVVDADGRPPVSKAKLEAVRAALLAACSSRHRTRVAV